MTEIHLTIVVITALVVLYADHEGLDWIRGKKQMLSKDRVEVLHVLVSFGISALLLTGGLMFINRAEYLLQELVFIAKMVFVGALVVNGFFIGEVSRLATERTFASLSAKERLPLYISGGVSFVGWVGAIVLGLLL